MRDLPLGGRRIVLGVSGSIAAYKAAEIVSRLVQGGAEVHVVLTSHAREFIGAATFRGLTGNPVLTDVFDEPYDGRMAHISLAQGADLFLVAPATANLLAKMANGIADDVLTTMLLATDAPVIAAPAMNTVMFDHPATVANLSTLRQRGVEIVEPAEGRLACGSDGKGRLADPDAIVAAVHARIRRSCDLTGLRFLISAGAGSEPIDPVRLITNRSSGRMGVALARAAARRGGAVVLVAGHRSVEPPPGVEVVRFDTTASYRAACLERFPACDVFIGAAAPADFTPVTVSQTKIRRDSSGADLMIPLRSNPDVIAELAAQKDSRLVVGFAAESEDLRTRALEKLRAKGLDLIVANDITAEDAGFDVPTNRVVLVWPDGRHEDLPLMTKDELAHQILDRILGMTGLASRTPSPA